MIYAAIITIEYSRGIAMEIQFRVCVVAGFILLAGSCATTTEVILPALDAPKIRSRY